MSTNKFEEIPTSNVANPILLSMGDFKRLELSLQTFRRDNGIPLKESQACSSTLIWSGDKGNNVPVKLFGNAAFGFTLDPSKIIVPHAEFIAFKTGSIVPSSEVPKEGALIYSGFPKKTAKSHYLEKKGRIAPGHAHLDNIYTTNHAKWLRPKGSTGEYGVYAKKGEFSIFAANVWRKFHKRDITSLNEALVLQKGEENPINGIVIRAELFNSIQPEDKEKLADILKKNPNLKMFIYDTRLEEHIMREMTNESAIELLKVGSPVQELDTAYTEKLKPFKGFDVPYDVQSKLEEIASRDDNTMSESLAITRHITPEQVALYYQNNSKADRSDFKNFIVNILRRKSNKLKITKEDIENIKVSGDDFHGYEVKMKEEYFFKLDQAMATSSSKVLPVPENQENLQTLGQIKEREVRETLETEKKEASSKEIEKSGSLEKAKEQEDEKTSDADKLKKIQQKIADGKLKLQLSLQKTYESKDREKLDIEEKIDVPALKPPELLETTRLASHPNPLNPTTPRTQFKLVSNPLNLLARTKLVSTSLDRPENIPDITRIAEADTAYTPDTSINDKRSFFIEGNSSHHPREETLSVNPENNINIIKTTLQKESLSDQYIMHLKYKSDKNLVFNDTRKSKNARFGGLEQKITKFNNKYKELTSINENTNPLKNKDNFKAEFSLYTNYLVKSKSNTELEISNASFSYKVISSGDSLKMTSNLNNLSDEIIVQMVEAQMNAGKKLITVNNLYNYNISISEINQPGFMESNSGKCLVKSLNIAKKFAEAAAAAKLKIAFTGSIGRIIEANFTDIFSDLSNHWPKDRRPR